MAGGGSGGEGDDENPVPVNATALIDIIFCLIIFFMASFHFKAIDGRIDSWLPKDKGVNPSRLVTPVVLEEIRVNLSFDEATRAVVTRLGARPVGTDGELVGLIRAAREEYEAMRKQAPVSIDAEARVPWAAVVRLIGLFEVEKLGEVELAGARPRG